MMDTAFRVQPTSASKIVTVDRSIMGMCNTSVLVNSVVVRHLPINVSEFKCGITITVNGTAHTLPAIMPEREMGEVNEVTGTTSFLEEDGKEIASCGGRSGVFKLSYDNLGLLFPGNRMRAGDMGKSAKMVIEDPRRFTHGMHVTVHSANMNQVFGSTLCTYSGEAMSLSFPRGEAIANFRVYPVINGEAEMSRLFNKSSFVTTYFGPNAVRVSSASPAAITEKPADAMDEGEEKASANKNAAGEFDDAVDAENEAAGTASATAEDETSEANAAEAEEVEKVEGVTVVQGGEAEQQANEENSQEEEESEESAMEVAVVPLRPPIDWSSFIQVPCYTEEQRQAAFAATDKDNKGYLTYSELMGFCKSDCAYADSWVSDDQMIRSLLPNIREDQHISYDLFSYVCLKLACS